MEYHRLGRAGIKVSQLSFGSWLTFGDNLDTSKARRLMHQAFDHGVNFFDNAEVYADGLSETIMGQALKSFKREDLVVSTKIFWGGDGPNDVGLSRKHLFEATKNSLKRMELDYVDLLYCHRPDPNTPIEETVRAMSDLVTQGYAFYWGTSEWSAKELHAAHQAAKALNCIAPTMEQPEYNLFRRDRVEQEYLSLYEEYGMGLTIWSPLAFGILTGKYSKGIPTDSRLAKYPQWQREGFEEQIKKTDQLTTIAAELNCSMTQLALAWCLQNPHVSSVILGATSEQQLKENIGCLTVVDKLTPDIMAQIDKIV